MPHPEAQHAVSVVALVNGLMKRGDRARKAGKFDVKQSRFLPGNSGHGSILQITFCWRVSARDRDPVAVS